MTIPMAMTSTRPTPPSFRVQHAGWEARNYFKYLRSRHGTGLENRVFLVPGNTRAMFTSVCGSRQANLSVLLVPMAERNQFIGPHIIGFAARSLERLWVGCRVPAGSGVVGAVATLLVRTAAQAGRISGRVAAFPKAARPVRRAIGKNLDCAGAGPSRACIWR